MIELAKTEEELRRAKHDMAQLWLGVRPLIHELEKLQSNLATAKNQKLMLNAVTEELEAELETTENAIRFKTEIRSKLKSKISELKESLDRTLEKMEELELKKDKQRQSRRDLKQALRLNKQSLKTLQLALRAIGLESESTGSSVTGAVRNIYCSETDVTTVELSHEEYFVLKKNAEEESLLADWRVSVSEEHRLMAKESRDSALRRLKELSKVKLKERENSKQRRENSYALKEQEERKSKTKADKVTDEEVAYTKVQPKLIPWSSKESSIETNRRLPLVNRRLRRIKRSVQLKKPSMLVRIRSCLKQKAAIWFR